MAAMVSSASGLLAMLGEQHPALKLHALHQLNSLVHLFWPEISTSVPTMVLGILEILDDLIAIPFGEASLVTPTPSSPPLFISSTATSSSGNTPNSGDWVVFDDRCPHRLAPLPE